MSDSHNKGAADHSTDVRPSDTIAECEGVQESALGDLVSELHESPELIHNRSFVLECAVAEFKSLAIKGPGISPDDYSRRFADFGSSLQSSIKRQVEVERFFDRCPEIGELNSGVWPRANERVGKFEILEEIGRGGLSRVYLCRQRDIGDRHVVVKLGGSGLLEAHTLGRLRHPNIVPIHSTELEAETGRAMLCMPFLGRSTLHDLIDVAFEKGCPASAGLLHKAARLWHQPSDQLTDDSHHLAQPRFADYFECVAYIGERVADALAHAHAQHVVHGDLKPSNILLSHRGEPLLMDFNLSGNAALDVIARGGTLPYMPPEQVHLILGDGLDRPYDERSDIYSLGAVLYELLTGQPPHLLPRKDLAKSDLASELLRRQSNGFTPLLTVNSAIPSSLANAVEKCLEVAPANRFATADEMRCAFSGELRPGARRRRWIASKRSVWAPTVALLLVISSLWTAFVLSRDPLHIRQFDSGKQLLDGGNLAAAQVEFENSLATRPDFEIARFELGRTLLRQGKLDAALHEFSTLSVANKRPRDLAYLAYCLSLQGRFTDALPWYRLAAQTGAQGHEFHNDYAVALESGKSEYSLKERAALAEKCLLMALREAPQSPAARLNWILHESRKPTAELSHESARTVQIAVGLAREFPDNCLANECAAFAIGREEAPDESLLAAGQEFLIRAISMGRGPSRSMYLEGRTWKAFRDDPHHSLIMAAFDSGPSRSPHEAKISRLLEPISLCLVPDISQ